MLSARTLMVTLAIAAAGALAQLVNPIIRPTVGDTLYAGGSFDIIWNVTTPNELVSLLVCKGPSTNIARIGVIADSITDSGSFEWSIPSDLASGNDYAVEIVVGPASNAANVGPDGYNFTPLLPLVNNSTGPASNATTTASTASTSASGSAAASGSTASESGVSTTSATSETTAATVSGLFSSAAATSGGTEASSSATATATAKSSAATVEMMNGHAFIALVFAVVFGMVAAF